MHILKFSPFFAIFVLYVSKFVRVVICLSFSIFMWKRNIKHSLQRHFMLFLKKYLALFVH